jgi:hypothetical protein
MSPGATRSEMARRSPRGIACGIDQPKIEADAIISEVFFRRVIAETTFRSPVVLGPEQSAISTGEFMEASCRCRQNEQLSGLKVSDYRMSDVGPLISLKELVPLIIKGHRQFAPVDCDCDICQGTHF